MCLVWPLDFIIYSSVIMFDTNEVPKRYSFALFNMWWCALYKQPIRCERSFYLKVFVCKQSPVKNFWERNWMKSSFHLMHYRTKFKSQFIQSDNCINNVKKVEWWFNPILGGVFVLPILGGGWGQICPPYLTRYWKELETWFFAHW